MNKQKSKDISRRDFMKASATTAVSLGALSSISNRAFAAGSDKIRIGLVGCGDRGSYSGYTGSIGATENCITSAENVELFALADVFQDKIDVAVAKLRERLTDKINVAKERQFVGFDAYKKLLATDIDVVLLVTPAGFRPEHLRAAVEAGKHVFMEKPGAVDPVGVRSLIESGEIAKRKGLSIVVGTQRRRSNAYNEVIKRIHDGKLGRITGGQARWFTSKQDWHFAERKRQWSDMEWQLRCWPFFTWLSGDHINDQLLHNMDVMNWALAAHPIRCVGIGGRQTRTGPQYGNIYDHFAIEYEYPGGVRVSGMTRQAKGTSSETSERVVGTKAHSYTNGAIGKIDGEYKYQYDGKEVHALVQEHTDLINSIRNGKPINEAKQLAESSLTVIMGRMSAYTGRPLKWDWVMNASKLDLRPEKYELGDLPVRPIAIPGQTKLI